MKKDVSVPYLKFDGRMVPGSSEWQKGYLSGIADVHMKLREEFHRDPSIIRKSCATIELFLGEMIRRFKGI